MPKLNRDFMQSATGRDLIYAAILLAGFVIFTGCNNHQRSDPDTLVVGLSNRPTSLDPRFATDAQSERVTDLIFSSLVRSGPELRPVAQAATSWRLEDKKITLHLRTDLQFHTGRPVVIADVLYSLAQYRKPSSPFASAFSSITEVVPIADGIVIKLKNNDAPLMSNLNLVKILPREEVEKGDEYFSRHPVGSGPYRFVSTDNNHLLITTAPSSAPYAHPKIKNILFKYVRDDNTRFLKMIKGDLDVLLNELAEEKVIEARKQGNLNVVLSPGLSFNYLLLNLRDSRLKHRDFRAALFASLNREEIVKFKLDDLAFVATSILAPLNPFSAHDLHLPAPNLVKARETIQQYAGSDVTLSLKSSDQALPNAQILAQQIEATGLKINVQSFEWGTFYNDVKSGHYEIALMRWVGIVDPDVYRDTLDSTEVPPGKNRGYYANKNFDKIVEEGRRQNNFKKRRELYRQAQEIIAEELPILPLWYNANISILNKRVKNFTPIITGSFYPLMEVTKEHDGHE